METYKDVFARFVFSPELEAEVERIADAALKETCGRLTGRLPRIEALRSASEFREGFAMAMRDVAPGYRCYEHLTFSELVPGYKERFQAWSDADPKSRPPDVLADHELRQTERFLFCAMALARALHRTFHPYHNETHVPFAEFAAAVRRAFASQGFPIHTSDTPLA